MKKSVISFCLFVGMSSFFISCQNELDEFQYPDMPSESTSDLIEYTTLSFIYNDKTYTSDCEIIGDSTVILDENVKLVAESLALKPELASFVQEDGMIEYFDNHDLLKKKHELEVVTMNGVMTRHYVKGAKLQMFDDVNFKDRSITFEGDDFEKGTEIPQLKDSPYKFNDKMSSFKFVFTGVVLDDMPYRHQAYTVTFWEDDHYKNHNVTFTIEAKDIYANSFEVSSLKSIPLYPGSSKNWNDKVTSLKLGRIK